MHKNKKIILIFLIISLHEPLWVCTRTNISNFNDKSSPGDQNIMVLIIKSVIWTILSGKIRMRLISIYELCYLNMKVPQLNLIWTNYSLQNIEQQSNTGTWSPSKNPYAKESKNEELQHINPGTRQSLSWVLIWITSVIKYFLLCNSKVVEPKSCWQASKSHKCWLFQRILWQK